MEDHSDNHCGNMQLHEDDNRYDCGTCGQHFEHAKGLKQHIKESNGLNMVNCSICEQIFCNKRDCMIHEQIHKAEPVEQYKCAKCGMMCSKYEYLKMHYRHAHCEGKQWKEVNLKKLLHCKVCNIEFEELSQWKKHNQDKHNKEPVTCTKCKREFSKPGNLMLHYTNVHKDVVFHCKMCTLDFDHSLNLKEHLRNIHTQQVMSEEGTMDGDRTKLYKCLLCDMLVGNENDIGKHIVNHHITENQCSQAEAEKNTFDVSSKNINRCLICNKYFSEQDKLKRHFATHVKEKTYSCPTCKRGFNVISVLHRHMKIHEEREFICEVCGKEFARKDNLKQHSKIHSNQKQYKCHVCEASFAQGSGLVKHIKIHDDKKDHICVMCGKGFCRLDNMLEHVRTHIGEKLYQCDVCSKMFAQRSGLTKHMKSHSSEKVYCSISGCHRGFSRPDNLKQHIKTCHNPHLLQI